MPSVFSIIFMDPHNNMFGINLMQYNIFLLFLRCGKGAEKQRGHLQIKRYGNENIT